jgi:hypothetical protein
MKKLRLIENWRDFWRFWSVRLGIVGSAVAGWLIAFPDHALQAWLLLPPDLKAVLPEEHMPLFGVGIFVLSLLARVLKQSKLEKES